MGATLPMLIMLAMLATNMPVRHMVDTHMLAMLATNTQVRHMLAIHMLVFHMEDILIPWLLQQRLRLRKLLPLPWHMVLHNPSPMLLPLLLHWLPNTVPGLSSMLRMSLETSTTAMQTSTLPSKKLETHMEESLDNILMLTPMESFKRFSTLLMIMDSA